MAQKRTDWYECGLLVAIFNSFAKCMLFLIVISEFSNEDKCKFCLALALNRNINTFLNERAHFVKRWQSGDKFSLSHSAPSWICINIYLFKYFIYNFSYLFTYPFFFGTYSITNPQNTRARTHTHSLSLSPFFFHFYLVNGKIHCGWKNSSNMFYPNLPCKGFLHLEKMKDRDGTPLIRLHPTPSPSLIFRLHPTSLLSVIFSGLIE